MNMRKKRDTTRILIILDLRYESNRQFLQGIARFARSKASWDVTVADVTEAHTALADAPKPFDAIFAKEDCAPDILSFYAARRRHHPPTCVFGSPGTPSADDPDIYFYATDNTAIGQKAAAYLLGLGNFASFGFYSDASGQSFIRQRHEGFLRELQRQGRTVEACTQSGKPDETGSWLKALAKPTAVFCAYDRDAVALIRCCQQNGIPVPRQVVVLGVDDDPVVTSFANPSVSSVVLPYESLGFAAAKKVSLRLSTGKTPKKRAEVSATVEICERDSSIPIAPSAHILAAAKTYIQQNARRHVTVEAVAKHLGISRKLLDLRFKEQGEGTVRELIARERFKAVCELLSKTDRPIGSIARSCGFANAPWLQTAFKRRFGLTMRAYRLQNAKASVRQKV